MIDIKKATLLFSITLAASLFTGCGIDNTDENIVGKAELVSVTPVFEMSSSAMQPVISMVKPGSPAFGIKVLKMVYKTEDQEGKEVEVSGLVTIPVPSQMILDGLKAKGKNYTMSIISDQHGTIFPDFESPTALATTIDNNATLQLMRNFPATLFSGLGGFITIQADMIGYGESNNIPHPYFLEKASANPVVDMIKATLQFGTDSNLPLNGQVYLTGYSEGGYVTLAAAKEIEANHPDIALFGVAPMSGPYDLNITGMGIISVASMDRPDFVGGIINSYALAYDYDLSTILNTPFDTTLPTLYNAADLSLTKEVIQASLTNDIATFFTPTFRGDFLSNPENALRVDFVNNSVDDYTPTTDTQLYYCSGDTVINPILAHSAAAKMGVPAIDLGALDHVPCAQPAYGAVAKWFDELRSK